MQFERTHDAGSAWARAGGATPAFKALLRIGTNRDVARLAALVPKAREVAEAVSVASGVAQAYVILRELPPGIVSRLVRHPSTAYWVATTTHLLRVHVGREVPSRTLAFEGPAEWQLAQHLADLHRIAVAGRVIALDTFATTLTPVHDGAFVLPTTGVVVGGVVPGVPLHIEAHAVDRSRIALHFAQGSRTLSITTDQPWALRDVAQHEVSHAHEMRLLPTPRVRGTGAGFEIDRWDPYLANAWVRHEVFPGGVPGVLDTETNLSRWASTLRGTMDLLAGCWPEMEVEISSMVGSVVPVAAPDDTRSLSVTAQDFPGALLCSLDPVPMMGEVLVHEYRHNLLNSLTAVEPVFRDDSPTDERFYSPWRDDPRSLNGLLHAMFTFSAVVDFHRRYLERGQPTPRNQRAAKRRAKAHAMRLSLAMRQFEAARLTPFGEGLVAGLAEVIADHSTFAETLVGPEVEDMADAVRVHAARAGVPLDILR
ncbi:MAG: HEXXH motif-containing putative peptide modification protein [Deltaproteobacteria bacterium]|nr:HEXXH motif-containing putative peptide modification protein [Myxococcales bacterium]MDP3220363.1 HEXXH motif-containing putative peptide modification protein [Deltaproteobacteria bacterium]